MFGFAVALCLIKRFVIVDIGLLGCFAGLLRLRVCLPLLFVFGLPLPAV
jgi:hypothetical protein